MSNSKIAHMQNNFPKLHNATWPGIVGKGPDSQPVIPFDSMLEMTAAAEVNGNKFDGVDIGLFDPHVDINMSDDDIKRLADKVAGYDLNIGSLVAPIWGGPSLGTDAIERPLLKWYAKRAILVKSSANTVFANMVSFVSTQLRVLKIGLKTLKKIPNWWLKLLGQLAMLPLIMTNNWPQKVRSVGGYAQLEIHGRDA